MHQWKRQGIPTLKNNVVGDRSLSRILKELQRRGLIHREVLLTYPISSSYSLTDKGKIVAKHLNELKQIL